MSLDFGTILGSALGGAMQGMSMGKTMPGLQGHTLRDRMMGIPIPQVPTIETEMGDAPIGQFDQFSPFRKAMIGMGLSSPSRF